jgi:hypothetical protein
MDDTKEEKKAENNCDPTPPFKNKKEKKNVGIYAHLFGVLTLELSVERN